ncbi:hypothetical protein [Mycoplasma suis]|uniref:Uncharacterized protein n=1 Tax=Mycoplasma suis (strain Illinois) TaxID=768700 RepID=F0QR61_MYCSL|nr:hypothetical protein [Mycoplasma suis]ADX97981.1 hypothetical protein MSU_0445 [Mycoplasma suis str. Illinois]
MEPIAWIITVSLLSIAFLATIAEIKRSKTLPSTWYLLCQKIDHRWILWRKGIVLSSEGEDNKKYSVNLGYYDGNRELYYLPHSCKLSLRLRLKSLLSDFSLEPGVQVLVLMCNKNIKKIIKIVKFK